MFPIVSPEAKTISTPPLLVRSAQFILVPLHEPDRKSTTASKFAEPITTTGGNTNAIITYPGSKFEKYDDFVRALQAGDQDIKIGWHSVASLLNIKQMDYKLNAPQPLTIPYKTSTD